MLAIGNSGFRSVRVVAGAIGMAMALLALYTAGFGQLDPIYHRSLVMGASALLLLLAEPLSARHAPGPGRIWRVALDVAMIAGILAATFWFLSVYDQLESGLYDFTPLDQAMALVGIGVLMELTRRSMGLPLVLFALACIAYSLFGGYLPWIFRHSSFGLEETLRTLWYSFDGVFGLPASVMLGYIFIFIVFGTVLEGTGAGDVLLKIMFSLSGSLRGGAAHAAVFASALFGTISGSITANVVSTGVFTIPMIKRQGFSADFAGGVEAAASSGGQIMPPVMGAAAFVMSEITGVPYFTICLAALLPSLFYYAGISCAVAVEAHKLGIAPLPAAERPKLTRTDLLHAQMFLVPIVVIVAVMVSGRSAAMAGFLATLVALAMGLVNPELRRNPKRLVDTFAKAGHAGAKIMVALGTIGIVIATMNLTGLGLRFSNMVLALGEGNLLASLLLSMLACLVLGMGMPTVPAYLIIVLVMGPAIKGLGVSVLQIHMFVLYFGVLSAITPPVAIAAYAAAPIAQSNPIKTGLIGSRLALAGFVIPYMFIFDNELLLVEGFTIPGLLWVLLRLSLLIWLVTTALAGYGIRAVPAWSRGARIVAAAALLVDSLPVQGAGFIAGLGLALLPLLTGGARKPAPGLAKVQD